MKKGLGVTLIIGLAMMLLAGMGTAIRAGEFSDRDRRRRASQPRFFRTWPASGLLFSGFHEGQSQQVSRPTLAAAIQEIQSTRRISIPYGFTTPMRLNAEGEVTGVAGHGGCTKGEQVTIAVTLTQTSTTALATGQTQQVCSGELQAWGATVAPVPGAAFAADPAEACGKAVTHDGETITDDFVWCRDVDLVFGVYLPLVVHADQ
jgi:hypothetical protein